MNNMLLTDQIQQPTCESQTASSTCAYGSECYMHLNVNVMEEFNSSTEFTLSYYI